MITQLRLQNFKCFADAAVACAPLTLLVGANASGKSSVIQSLLLLRQSHQSRALSQGELLLNGKLTGVGTAQDALLQNAEGDTILFGLGVQGQPPIAFAFDYPRGETDRYTISGPPQPYDPQIALFQPEFNYLNAERIGPRLLYPMSQDDALSSSVGTHGEFAAAIIARDRDKPIVNEALAYQDETTGEVSRLLLNQTRYWMRQFIPNFDLDARAVREADQVQLLFGNRIGQDLVRPTNIGFGLIYTLPIIVAALVAPPGSLLIVENPEAHLHPRSQSAIGAFLARVAAAGVQVIIETHSDHVLNGIRRAVRNQTLAAEAVSIQFFVAATQEQPAHILTPKMYPSGGIDPWPTGFFDQFENDLLELL